MNVIADIQSSIDTRNQAIQRVGIKRLKRPIRVESEEGAQNTVAEFTMCVSLGERQRGTHMSRFIALLEEFDKPLSHGNLKELLERTKNKLGSEEAEIEVSFPFFRKKKAPVSGCESLMDYEVVMRGTLGPDGYVNHLVVKSPITSLCPCSKEISDYGAHNQRSYVTVSAKCDSAVHPEEIIDLVERNASCELYGVLKRPDEKKVTETAYENPKFVEDIVRDIAAQLKEEKRISFFTVESENLESIHNHSAYAKIIHPA